MIGVTAAGLTIVAAMSVGGIWITVTGVIVTTDDGLIRVAGRAGLIVIGVDGVIRVAMTKNNASRQCNCGPPAGLKGVVRRKPVFPPPRRTLWRRPFVHR